MTSNRMNTGAETSIRAGQNQAENANENAPTTAIAIAEEVAFSSPSQQQQQPTEMPMSMTASMMLTKLPGDTAQAMKEVEKIDDFKVPVRFSALPSAPALGKQKVFATPASQRFEAVVTFLRKKLKLKEHEALFCYVNSVFAPGLDEGVGNLYRCFKTDDRLNVSYSITPAFG